MSHLRAKPSTSSKGGQQGQTRDPPPSLFLHPSREASHVSLPGGDGGPNHHHHQYQYQYQQHHQQQQQTNAPSSSSQIATTAIDDAFGAALTPTLTSTSTRTRHHHHQHLTMPSSLPTTTIPRLQTGDSSRATDRTDALWASMQATLEDVELSATGGTRVFGPDHDRALADLRTAQIALAQAWARSEADDAIESGSSSVAGAAGALAEPEVANLRGKLGDLGITPTTTATPPNPNTNTGAAAVGDPGDGVGRSSAAGTATRPGSSGGGGGGGIGIGAAIVGAGTSMGLGFVGEQVGARLEQETERDILHARRRREANDRYFGRVDQGVRDVVARLEEVAAAMRAVEHETRDVWGDDASVPASAKA